MLQFSSMRPVILGLILLLVSCSKRASSPDPAASSSGPPSAVAASSPDSSAPRAPRGPLAPGTNAKRKHAVQTAVDYAHTDPAAGIAWIEANIPADDSAGLSWVYDAFLRELLKSDRQAAFELYGRITDPTRRAAFSRELYTQLATLDPDLAWASAKAGRALPSPENRFDAYPLLIATQTAEKGFDAALEAYRVHVEEGSASDEFFLSHIGSQEGLSHAEAAKAIALLGTLPESQTYHLAVSNVGANIAVEDRAQFLAYLDSQPLGTRYDGGYAQAASLNIRASDPIAAARWIARIQSPMIRSIARGELAEALRTADSATRGKVDAALRK